MDAVEQVVYDLVQYVVRKEDLSRLPSTIDPEVLHIPPKQTEKLIPCRHEFCAKGCICDSLDDKVAIRHCGKEECIFHCICKTRVLHSLRSLPHRNKLIKMNSGKSGFCEIHHSQNRSKPVEHPHEKSRGFEENLSVCLSPESKNYVAKQSALVSPESEVVPKKREKYKIEIHQTSLEMRLRNLKSIDRNRIYRIIDGVDQPLELKENFMWCTVHKRYSCLCSGTPFNVRTNHLLFWIPSIAQVKEKKISLHQLFDPNRHSARTCGSPYDYLTRNRSFIFTTKRVAEIESGVMSNSNGFIKIDLPPTVNKPVIYKETKKSCEAINNDNVISLRQKRLKFITVTGEPGERKRANIVRKKLRIKRAKDWAKSKDDVMMIVHNNSSESEEDPERPELPEYGLLCLNNYGLGYLPVRELTPERLVFLSPLPGGKDICVASPKEASERLNRLFRAREVLDPLGADHTWVLVKRGVLRKYKRFSWDNLYVSSPVQDSDESTDCFIVDT